MDLYQDAIIAPIFDSAGASVPGPEGPPGPIGPAGPEGPTGPQGDKGEMGETGPAGPTGPRGEKGQQGDPGPVGPQGPRGLDGAKGDKGDTGLRGPIGPQGIEGPTGPAGQVGPIGPAGPVGPKGDKGDDGAPGPKGDKGEDGSGSSTTWSKKDQFNSIRSFQDITSIQFLNDVNDIEADTADTKTLKVPLGISVFADEDGQSVEQTRAAIEAKYTANSNKGKLVYCSHRKEWWGSDGKWNPILSDGLTIAAADMVSRFPPDVKTRTIENGLLIKENLASIGTYVGFVPKGTTGLPPTVADKHNFIISSFGGVGVNANVGFQMLYDVDTVDVYVRYLRTNLSPNEWTEWTTLAESSAATKFHELMDTPTGYAQHAGKVVCVNQDETGLEFVDISHDDIRDKITEHDDTLSDHSVRIEAIEMGGGGGSVDLTPVLGRLKDLEDGHGDQETRLVDVEAQLPVDLNEIEGRLDVLESVPPVDLKPLEDRVDALENAPAPPAVDLTPLEDRMALGEAHDTAQDATLITHENRITAIELGGGSGGDVDLTPILDRLVGVELVNAAQTSSIDAHDVRIETLEDAPPVDLKPLEDRVEALETVPGVDLTPIEDRLDGVEVKNDTQDVRIDAQSLRIDMLEIAPVPKFTELRDTPSGYHPNQLIGYNLAGDALIPVDKLENFTQLKDTPLTYTGQARKIPMVRPDESGMDFVVIPPPDLTAIEDRLDGLDGKDSEHDVRLDEQLDRINSLELHDHIDKFTKLRDTPSGYHPNKLVGYNLAGDALIPVDKTESFIQLNDVPATWVGNARKVPMVRPDETGMDFVMLPSADLSPLEGRMDGVETTIVDHENRITAIELGGGPGTGVDLTPVLDRLTSVEAKNTEQDNAIDRHLVDFDSMATGQIPTSWNGLACDPMSSSGDVTAANIAASPFCVGMGTSTGKKFILPNIVDGDSISVTNSQVREGRVTYLVNLGTNPRIVEMTGGCKINITGSNVTTNQSLPSKVVWMLSPGIYSNGDRVWTFLGSYSAEPLDYTELSGTMVSKDELATGSVAIDSINCFSDGSPTWDNVTQVQAAKRQVVNFWGTSTNRGLYLPDIADAQVVSLPTNSVRSGRVLTVANHSTTSKFIRLGDGCQFYKDGDTITSDDINILKGSVIVLLSHKSGATKYWQLIGSYASNASVDHEALMNRITTLEGKPHPKFIELRDTPGGYQPGKMVGYNLAGDALIAVDKIDEFLHLKDTPTNYTGSARKIPMVRPDESGMDFVDLPVVDLTGIETRLDEVEDKNDTQDTRLGAQSLRIDVLEVAPRITKFNELTDTPNDYRSGRILAYNMAGDGITSLAPFNHLTSLDDTPTSYSGQKRKALVVKEDESGTEFVSMPNLAPLQTEINNLHNDVIGLGNEQTIQDTAIDGLDTRVTVLESGGGSSGAADEWITKVETGDSSAKVNSNCMFGTMQIADDNLSAANLTACAAGYVYGTTARTAILPKIVDVDSPTLAAEECRFGKIIKLNNMSNKNMTVTVHGGGRVYQNDGSFLTSMTIVAGAYADFHAVWWPGGFNNFAWIMSTPVGSFIGQNDTPASYDAKKYVVVNAAGTGIEFSSMDTDEVAGMAALATGASTGGALINQNCLGAPCVLSGEQSIASSQIATSAMILVSAWQDSTTVNLPRIAAYNISPLPANYVRAGRITSIYNRTANSKSITIKPDPAYSALKMKNKAYTNINTLTLTAGQVARFMPVIDAGVQAWVLIEQYAC